MINLQHGIRLDARRQALGEGGALGHEGIAAGKRARARRAHGDAAHAGDARVDVGSGRIHRVDRAGRTLSGAGAAARAHAGVGLSAEGHAVEVAVRAVAGDVDELGIACGRGGRELVRCRTGESIDCRKVNLVGAALGDIDHQRMVRHEGAERDRDEAVRADRIGKLEEGVIHRAVAEGDDEDRRRIVPLAARELCKRRGGHAAAVGGRREDGEVVGAECGDIGARRGDVDRVGSNARGFDRSGEALGDGAGRSRAGEVRGGAGGGGHGVSFVQNYSIIN